MRALGSIVRLVTGPLVMAAFIFVPAFAADAYRPAADNSVAAAFVISAGLIGLAGGGWAAWMLAHLGDLRQAAAQDRFRAGTAIRFREELLNNGGQAVMVLRSDEGRPLVFGNARALFRESVGGPDAAQVADNLDALLRVGKSFALPARAADGHEILLRGVAIGRHPAVYFQDTGKAADIVDIEKLQARLQRTLQAHAGMLERLPLAVAVFDADRRLANYNSCYAKLWGLSAAWLDTGPPLGEILDRLRDDRKLPECRDFLVWKREQLRAAGDGGGKADELWHLPNGDSIRVTGHPHLEGGAVFLFEDVTERLRLQTSLNLQSQVQRAMLDRMEGAVAVFGTDGRLVLHNAHFAKLWRLSEDELSAQPHFTAIASLCAGRLGRDGIWNIVSAGVNSMEPERYGEWSRTRRADGRFISLSMSRLPNGATVVTFEASPARLDLPQGALLDNAAA